MIAGLDTPSAGRILIDGRDVTGVAPAQRRISMVFQSYALFPHLERRREHPVRRSRCGASRRRSTRAGSLASPTCSASAQLLERKPSQLSGGQQQRVALGRAIIAETPVCLMDEPLSNLDAQLRQEMRREIRALQQQLGITMVYVTHDQTEAMSMADQVVLLRDGRIEQDAPPADLYARPATVFAARFIGTPPMNIIAAPGRADLQLGVRPEHVRVVAEGGRARGRAERRVPRRRHHRHLLASAGGTLADTLAARLPGRYRRRRARAFVSAGPPRTATTSTPRPAAAATTSYPLSA